MWGRKSLIILAVFCQGCSALPQLVRHSDPLSADEHVQLGNAYEEQGLHDQAIDQYRAAIHIQKHNTAALNNLAMVYVTSGKNLKDAERSAQKALKLGGPLQPYVLDTLATIHIRENRFSEAKKELDNAMALTPATNKPLLDQLAKTREKIPG